MTWICETCQKRLKTKDQLKTHASDLHSPEFECNGVKYERDKDSGNFQCRSGNCELNFSSPSRQTMKNHLLRQHKNPQSASTKASRPSPYPQVGRSTRSRRPEAYSSIQDHTDDQASAFFHLKLLIFQI